MIRILPALLELALLVFCLIDCIQTDKDRVRNLPKVAWIVLIILLPLVGGIAWLVAGRPQRVERRSGVWYADQAGFAESSRPAPPSTRDIDDRLAADQARVDAEFDDLVRRARTRGEGEVPGSGG
ncbi:PLD nuclease N-terminal domain-containing protein [Kineococcus gynurae]|uniref:PLD nuclease N-terminal domain-containing protein n=1 Tax=Kineococcus gynurae TaxID=452979 RepID=A0ABV5LQF2_9ACTN